MRQPADMPEYLKDLASPILRFLKGNLALVSSRILHWDYSHDDVEFIIPQNARAAPITKFLPKSSRVILMWTKTKDSWWQKEYSEFKLKHGAELAFKVEYKQLEEVLGDMFRVFMTARDGEPPVKLTIESQSVQMQQLADLYKLLIGRREDFMAKKLVYADELLTKVL